MNRSIPVAFISYFFDMGGVQRSLLSIAEHLKDRGFSFHMINLRNDFFQDRFRACGYCRYIPEPADVVAYLKERNIQIVHTNNCDAGSYFAYLAGVPRIVERLDGYASAFMFDKTPVDCVVASTNDVYERALREYPNKYVKLICNGIDTTLFRPGTRSGIVRDKLGIAPDDIVIGSLGRISREKRQDFLLDMFARLREDLPNAKLVLIGNDHNDGYRDYLHTKIDELNLYGDAWVLGGTENPHEIIPDFDIGVLATGPYTKPDGTRCVPREGYSNAVMEKMACGIPVVATDCGELSTLVAHNKTGYIVDINNPDDMRRRIMHLIHRKELRERMGRTARRVIERHFDTSRMIDSYERLYRELLDDRFSKQYPDSRLGTEKYFLNSGFDEHNLDDKKILIVRSGSKRITDSLIQQLENRSAGRFAFLCNQNNYQDVAGYGNRDAVFVYDASDRFDPEKMSDLLSKINEEYFDVLFFILNDFNGLKFESSDAFYSSLRQFKQSSNIFELCDSIQASRKVAVTATGQMYRW